MQEENSAKVTLGSAIDRMLAVLTPLDETSRRTALRAVCEQLGIVLEQVAQHAPGAAVPSEFPQPVTKVQPDSTRPVDIRSFAKEKAPSSGIEQAALVAYYLSELAPQSERKDSINKDDLTKYFKQAEFRLPKRPEQTLVNARAAGYLDPAGAGTYCLNPVGYNLIVHNLPREHKEKGRGERRSPAKQGKPSRRASK